MRSLVTAHIHIEKEIMWTNRDMQNLVMNLVFDVDDEEVDYSLRILVHSPAIRPIGGEIRRLPNEAQHHTCKTTMAE